MGLENRRVLARRGEVGRGRAQWGGSQSYRDEPGEASAILPVAKSVCWL